MELIDRILSDGNIKAAIQAVRSNKGAAGIDKMTVYALEGYFAEHGEEIKEQIRAKKYKPQPVRRVYIPKANGKQRPLGIPTVVDRVIQQAIAQILSRGYERYFSEYSHGFRPNRSCHTAMEQALVAPYRKAFAIMDTKALYINVHDLLFRRYIGIINDRKSEPFMYIIQISMFTTG